ncbi:HD domain-containing protein [Thermosulfuriphilus ammonigenes]|uniref:HD domain-containing protein n=1 Tax=Thermosulfuriphilus ammonigenes TaxID=1936021 RepID=A0A6G7PT44_9BACT|nr:HD domain-containing protein [Thermosulfuriphilus ammonigenes]MBA2849234.1 putative nucleotidyltransferase with HDIG domain [Thermosulfuriphilus ammonigenes]QIJ70849.1 HD domain-containing protein [Thermosulfuriphilus ammonigenes]
MKEATIALKKIILSLADALDCAHPSLVDHQLRVTYASVAIARALDLSPATIESLLYAASLHDIGLFTIREKLEGLRIEEEKQNIHHHMELGYLILREFSPFQRAAEFIRYHHVDWSYGQARGVDGEPLPLGANIIRLADRLETMIWRNRPVLLQAPSLRKAIGSKIGEKFAPEVVEAFLEISSRESFWLDLTSSRIYSVIIQLFPEAGTSIGFGHLDQLTSIFSLIIDLRSPFTATHSAGVAAVAEKLAEMFGFSPLERRLMRVAGYLHDLGKLAVSEEILNKPGPLNAEEVSVMRGHTYFTYHILETIPHLETVNQWASFHHERLDGRGYPFRLNDTNLSLGSRIMAVADVFVALCEDRPYRKSMDGKKVASILKDMAGAALDPRVVSLALENFEEINEIRRRAQEERRQAYQRIRQEVEERKAA